MTLLLLLQTAGSLALLVGNYIWLPSLLQAQKNTIPRAEVSQQAHGDILGHCIAVWEQSREAYQRYVSSAC